MTPKNTIVKKMKKMMMSLMDGPYHKGMPFMDDHYHKMTDLLDNVQFS